MPDELLAELLKRTGTTDPETALTETLNVRPINDDGSLPPRPPMFQTDVPVVGPPELGKMVKSLLSRAPYMSQVLKEVRMGPNKAIINLLGGNRPSFGPDEYDQTNLLGHGMPSIFSKFGLDESSFPLKGEVSLNPRLAKDNDLMEQVLTHELAHIAGRMHGVRGEVWDMLKDAPADKLKSAQAIHKNSADYAEDLMRQIQLGRGKK